ncbi:MAG: DinB family protein [Planctomycetes bacterium]|nr:DinB family protein [Planctomycetota bacterium]
MDRENVLREHVLYLLRGGGAHLSFAKAVENLPENLRGAKPDGIPYSPWQLLEHMCIAQWDILEFCRNPDHVSPDFPDGYWPAGNAPGKPTAWDDSVSAFSTDLESMLKLVADPTTDLHCPLPHGTGQTILREALLVADHNAYHLGQLVVVRRALGAWYD